MQHRLLGRKIAVAEAMKELRAKPQRWLDITVRQDAVGSPHTDTECIYLRGPMELNWNGFQQDVRAKNYPAIKLLPECWKLAMNVIQKIPHVLIGRVVIVSLKPDGKIKPHADAGIYANNYRRYHLVMSTNFNCLSQNGNETVQMGSGELWGFDHLTEHSAENNGKTPRIMMIIDLK